jgi:predicted esterase
MTARTQLPSRVPFAREVGERPDGPLVVALHGGGHQIDDLLAFARQVSPSRELIAPVGCWGTYVGAMDLSGYTWFHEVPGVDGPEPVSFGRSLFDVEQLIDAMLPSESARAVVVGVGQGAALALALTAVLPDRLAAVVAIAGRPVPLPAGAVPNPVDAPPVPALWLAEPGERERVDSSGALAGLADATDLAIEPLPGRELLGDAARDRVAGWLEATGTTAPEARS